MKYLSNDGKTFETAGACLAYEHEQNGMPEIVQEAISKLVSSFLHFDRKDDEELTRAILDEFIEDGVVTADGVCAEFRQCLEESWPWNPRSRQCCRSKPSKHPNSYTDGS